MKGGPIFFLLFVLASGLMWVIGLVILGAPLKRVAQYSALSVLLVVVGLVVFAVLSAWAGILPLAIGDGALVRYSVSFPYGYLARGVIGAGILLVGILAIASPLVAVWCVKRDIALM